MASCTASNPPYDALVTEQPIPESAWDFLRGLDDTHWDLIEAIMARPADLTRRNYIHYRGDVGRDAIYALSAGSDRAHRVRYMRKHLVEEVYSEELGASILSLTKQGKVIARAIAVDNGQPMEGGS